MSKDPEPIVLPYYVCVLGQLRDNDREELIKFFTSHLNPHVHEFGLMLRRFDRGSKFPKNVVDFVIGKDSQIIDWLGLFHFIANGKNARVKSHLAKMISARLSMNGGRTRLRLALRQIHRALCS